MVETPNWTLWVAIYAAVVSTGLLILRIVEVVLGRGWVQVSTAFHPATDTQPALVVLSVRNKGLGDATVTRIDLDGPGPVRISLTGAELIADGPALPLKLEPKTSAIWSIDANRLKTVLRNNGWNYQVRGIVTLATGKVVWQSIHRYTTVY